MHEPVRLSRMEADHPVTAAAAVLRQSNRVFPGHERELSRLRRWLCSLLPDCPERDEVLSVATELGSNALEHTASGDPGGSFAVQVAWHQCLVQVAVADGGGPGEPRVIQDLDGERGRGLLLVHGLSARTGWTGDERGRVVCAQIAWPDDAGVAPDTPRELCQIAASAGEAALLEPFAEGAHPPAYCCRHAFTPACPIDCLAVVLSTATFHALARAHGAPFDPPSTVEQVLELRRAGRLGLVGGLGRRRLSEIDVALVMAGFALGGSAPSGRGPQKADS